MHTYEELRILQALPLEVKIEKTKMRIREFVLKYGYNNVYVSFSGGKDSTVLLDITRQIYPNIRAIFADTGLEYPEIRKFVSTFDNVIVAKPKMSFRQVILTHGYPIISKEISQVVEEYKRHDGTKYTYRKQKLEGTLLNKDGKKSKYTCEKYLPLASAPFNVSSKCCDEMKKKPLRKHKNPIVGTLCNESMARTSAWIKGGCNVFDKGKSQSKPMSFWTENDVLEYIYKYKLPICSVYGDVEVIGEYDDVDITQLVLDAFDLESNNCELTQLSPKTCDFSTTGCSRTGCVFCGFGVHLEKGESRFQMLKRTHPSLYNYCINGGEFDPVDGLWKPNKYGLGMGFVFDWCNNNIKKFKINY